MSPTSSTSPIDLGYTPRKWQIECHLNMQRFTVLALHRRAGKSELSIMHLIDRAMRFAKPMGLFFYVAPYLKQAKIIAWARLKQRLAPMIATGLVEVRESELYVRFVHNGAIIRIYGADNPDGIRGVHLDGVVIDEVAQIKREVWDDVIRPTLSDRKGWALFIGTPSGTNLFSELYFRAKGRPGWYSAVWTVYDTDALDPAEVELLHADMSEVSFAREYLCDFTVAGVDQLISLGQIAEATQRRYAPADIAHAPRIIGVDPARFGDDRSVIFKRQGLQAFPPLTFKGYDNVRLASMVAREIADWKPDAVFIDVGNGQGVIDILRSLGHPVTEVNFGSASSDPGCYLKRTQIWYEMASWIAAGGALPPGVAGLAEDLSAPQYYYDAANRRVLESKDDIKGRGLPSPDLGDALALTFAYPVEPKSRNLVFDRDHGVRQEPRKSYDPFSIV